MELTTWAGLYTTMEERWRPDDVAALSAILVPDLASILRPAARSAWFGRQSAQWFDQHGRPGFRGHSVDTSITARFPGLPSDATAAVALLRQQTGLASTDFRDRVPSPLRKAAGIDISRRQYNKRCRIQLALDRKLRRLSERGAFSRYARLALSGWALDISLPDFMALSPATRVFVAYYVARRQRQSAFSGTGQDRAWDSVAESLFTLSTPANVVALAFPDARVLRLLTDAQRADLLLRAYRDIREMSVTMSMLWRALGADRGTMVVQRGMNSSDWNAIAGAWNAVRSAWVALLFACGRDTDLDRLCPGKAMRLMAADVAAWHRSLGSDEGPDVKVFKRLPLPWDVVLGTAVCTRSAVEAACSDARVANGSWTTPRETGEPVPTRTTNALVHGVAISDPGLADVLRRAGWFSGKSNARLVDESVTVARDEQGFAQHVVRGVAQ